jgi:hypothetical protein
MALIIVLVTATVTYTTTDNVITGTAAATCVVSCNSMNLTLDNNCYNVNLGDFVLFISVGSDTNDTDYLPSSTILDITPSSNAIDIFNGTIVAIPGVSNMLFGLAASPKTDTEQFTISGTVYAEGATTPTFIPWTTTDPKITVVAPN